MNTDAVFSLIILSVFLLFFYGPWQEACVDWARQAAFKKRDAIFDLAMNGEMDFNSRQYRVIRHSIEQSIRFAHELTLPRFLILRFYHQIRGNLGRPSQLRIAVSQIEDEDTRACVVKLVNEMHVTMIAMMAARSPVTVYLWLVYIVAKAMSSKFIKRLGPYARPIGEVIQVEAESAPRNRAASYARAA